MNAETLYNSVDSEIREDVCQAIKWATQKLTEREGSGHLFEILAAENGMVVCTFSKPQWAGEHCSRPMETGSEAIVMAVCEYLNEA